MAFVVMARIQTNVSEEKRKEKYIHCGDCYVSYIILVMSYKWLLRGFSLLFSIKWAFLFSLHRLRIFNQFVTQQKCAILIHPHVELRLNAVFRIEDTQHFIDSHQKMPSVQMRSQNVLRGMKNDFVNPMT